MHTAFRVSGRAVKALTVALLVVIILAEWMWWESYTMTVDWSKRHEAFPLPFYVAYLPHWFIVDLSIMLITLSACALAYLALRGGEACSGS